MSSRSDFLYREARRASGGGVPRARRRMCEVWRGARRPPADPRGRAVAAAPRAVGFGVRAAPRGRRPSVHRGTPRPSSRGRRGLFARLVDWLQPIFSHPGLVAATSILLVAGVAGFLALHGKVTTKQELPRREVAHDSAAPTGAPTPVATQKIADLEDGKDRAATTTAEPRASRDGRHSATVGCDDRPADRDWRRDRRGRRGQKRDERQWRRLQRGADTGSGPRL